MFRFADPIYLTLLIALPVIVIIRWVVLNRRKRMLQKFADKALIGDLMENVSKVRPGLKFWLLITALAIMIVMLARPQMGSKVSNEKRQGIETIICMDVSNSMLAQDVVPSRLDKSKMLVENLMEHFTDDKVGLIVYAGDAFVQLPITADYVSAKMFTQNISPSLIASQGTDIAAAIRLALSCFTPDDTAGKAIIIITDGEDHEGMALEAAAEAKEKGVRVFMLGVGTENAAPIPVAGGGYMKDNMGETVMTKLNEEMCKQIAQAGEGTYIHVDNNSRAQEMLDQEIAKMQKGEVSTIIYSEYDEQYQAFAIIALILLVAEALIISRKNNLLKKWFALK